MQLHAGAKLGPYEILAPLGAGGMGEVYRARDTRLGRDVAVKVLPQHLSSNPEVRMRFEREARAVSSLNHPHICTLHDVGREGDRDYIVMELVEGETLLDRLTRGALPTADVVRIGAQIADALDRAHRAGIVHRDLKPGNVMLTRRGTKLMDFGLARATRPGDASGATTALSESPTAARPLTAEGTIVGTFQYMSPEQLEGKEADARSDLWALGCVLYEMATGKRAFEGATQASLISAIMRDQPRAMAELAPMSPPMLERLVGALLAKDPDERIQTAHDVKLHLQWAGDATSGGTSSVQSLPASGGARRGRGAAIGWGVAAVAIAVALVALTLPARRGTTPLDQRVRLTIQPPLNTSLSGAATAAALSPDGRTLAFVATDSSGIARLWLRDLDALSARVLAGTEHGDQPFWSPDGLSLAFFAGGKLKKIAIAGGMSEVICDAPDPRGGTWGSQGVIVFAPIATGALFSVSADGGEVTEVVRPDSTRKETALRFPEFLPDGRQFLFVSLPRRDGQYDVHIGRVGSLERGHIGRAGSRPVYAEPGYLIATFGVRLAAQRFDARSGKLSGKPITIADAPLRIGHDGVQAVSASRNGVLAYWSGSLSNTKVQWMDRTGRVTGVVAMPTGRWEETAISADGRRAMALRRSAASDLDLWMVDLESARSSRFTFRPDAVIGNAVWSPDGRRVAYSIAARGPFDLYVQSVTGGEPEPLLESDAQFKNPYSWSPDGKFIAFEQPDPETGWDVWVLPVEGDRKPIPVIRTPANEGGGWFSPDGRWIIYYSDEAGRPELYVQSFPQPSERFPLAGSATSGSGGAGPCWWSRDGREIMFVASDGTLRVASVDTGSSFRAGPTRVLFQLPDNRVWVNATPDLQRILGVVPVEGAPPSTIVIDMNWIAAIPDP